MRGNRFKGPGAVWREEAAYAPPARSSSGMRDAVLKDDVRDGRSM